MNTTTKTMPKPAELTAEEMKQAGGGLTGLLLPAVQRVRDAARPTT